MTNTIAAIVEPPGVSTVRATTSTGTSRMRPRVSALGRLSGNKPWSGYPAPPRQILDSHAAANGAERGDRRGEQRPGERAALRAVGHQQAEDDPAESVRPAQDQRRALAQAEDRRDEQGAEDAHLDEAVEPDGLEVGHAPETRWRARTTEASAASRPPASAVRSRIPARSRSRAPSGARRPARPPRPRRPSRDRGCGPAR